MTTSDSREGGAPPNHKTKRRSRRLSGPGRQALHDLYLILLIACADMQDQELASVLRANLNHWERMYL